jgi:hypothetical protein
LNTRETNLNRVKLFVNGVALGRIAVSGVRTVVMKLLDEITILIEVHPRVVGKKY